MNFLWVLSHSTYIDDEVTGSSSIENAKIVQEKLIFLLKKGGLELRKWCSNDSTLLDRFPDNHLCLKPLTFGEKISSLEHIIIGLEWNPCCDFFSFTAQVLEKPCTNLSLLSEVARLFDPLGFLTSITFYNKHLIQRLWLSGFDWDQAIPLEISNVWRQYK